MEDNNNTISAEEFFFWISSQATKHKIAASLGIDPFKDWYDKAYADGLRRIIRMIQDEEGQWDAKLSDIERSLYFNGFKDKLKNTKSKIDSYKKTHLMRGPKLSGRSEPLQYASLNEGLSKLWSKQDVDDIFALFYREGIAQKARERFHKKYNTYRGFTQAYTSALQNVIPRIKASEKPPFELKDLKKWELRIYAMTLNPDSPESIYKSIKSDDEQTLISKSQKIPKNAGNYPFEKGSFAKIGLNEATEDWTEAKIKKLIDKEVTSIIKKEKYLTEKEIKEVIRKSIVRMFKFLWEKSSFFIKQI